MSAPTYQTFQSRFRRLVEMTEPGDEEQAWISDRLVQAWNDAHPDAWGTRRAEAALLEVAHRWKMFRDDEANVAGPITSQKVGDLSVSFGGGGSVSGGDAWWRMTVYGQERVQLRNSVVQFDGFVI